MMRLRVVCPSACTAAVLDLLEGERGTAYTVLLCGAARVPPGDVVEAEIARESADGVVERLRELGCDRDGAIVLTELDTVLSAAAEEAERAAPGEGADAVVWEALVARTGQDTRLTASFVTFLTIACLLAAVGVVTNSPVTVVGAMVLGPEFGPLAALAVATVGRRGALAREAATALMVGFPVAVAITAAATGVARGVGLVPDDALTDLDQVAFVYQVGPFSLIVALLAGVAGMLALTSGGGAGPLVGVFISVTTVPAAGFVAVALVLRDGPDAVSSAAQLAVNCGGIVLACVLVLLAVRRSRRPRSRSCGGSSSDRSPPVAGAE